MVEVAGKMGWDRLNRTAKLYEVPGWSHCGAGTGPDDGQNRMLAALIDWVENGTSPQGIAMHRGADRAQLMFAGAPGAGASGVTVPQANGRSRDFLVCPFPRESTFDPSKAGVLGAVDHARNWRCRPVEPPRRRAQT